ncbi:MAG: ATP-binding protein [bacterium]|nr:ATP-binding protein [bacterium]
MIDILTKPANQVGAREIQSLVKLQLPESEQIEFKESLPSERNTSDPWIAGKDQIGMPAKDKIVKEGVAFANAHGGALLLGIQESDTNPPVATRISPVPRCGDLAERLKLVFRDRVEPQLPRLEIFSVPIEDSSGVVVIRVGRSRLAPHRVTKTLVCPIRRSDRCEAMTMREIQEMTLNASRGLERMEKRLSERSQRFRSELDCLSSPDDAWGIRLTAVPLGDEIQIDRVFHRGRLAEGLDEPWHSVLSRLGSSARPLAGLGSGGTTIAQRWRPKLRGARADSRADGFSARPFQNSYRELHCDGLIELGYVCVRGYPILPGLPVQMFANLAKWADRVRSQTLAPSAEYALEFEVLSTGGPLQVASHNPLSSLAFVEGSTRFPRIPLGDSSEIPEILALVNRDLWNSLGEDVDHEQAFEVQD